MAIYDLFEQSKPWIVTADFSCKIGLTFAGWLSTRTIALGRLSANRRSMEKCSGDT